MVDGYFCILFSYLISIQKNRRFFQSLKIKNMFIILNDCEKNRSLFTLVELFFKFIAKYGKLREGITKNAKKP